MDRKMLMAAAISAFACAGVGANAATVNGVIDFSNTAGLITENGVTNYYEDGFVFSPANVIQSDGQGNCPTTADGDCLQFVAENFSVMKREDNNNFTLKSFFLRFIGNAPPNSLVLSAAGFADVALEFGENYRDGVTEYVVKVIRGVDTDVFVSRVQNVVNAYEIQFADGYFANVKSIDFASDTRANLRIDTIQVAYDVPPVPLPATGLLLLGGLGGLAALRRKRKAA